MSADAIHRALTLAVAELRAASAERNPERIGTAARRVAFYARKAMEARP